MALTRKPPARANNHWNSAPTSGLNLTMSVANSLKTNSSRPPVFGVAQALALPVRELGGWSLTEVRLKVLGRGKAPNGADFGSDDHAEYVTIALNRLESLGTGAVRHFSEQHLN